MADTKITALAAISTIDAAVDPLAIVDVSDTSMAASGTTKKVTSQQILGSGGNASVGTLNASGAATLSSTLAVTGTSTFTGAMTANGNLTANANTTLGNAQTDIITINGQVQAREGELASSIRAAASNYAGVAFDGATALTRVVSTTTTQPISTGDFSVWIRCKIPSVSSTNQDPLFTLGSISSGDGSGAYGLLFRLFTSSNLVDLLIRDSGGLSSGAGAGSATATFTHANYAGQVVDFVITRTGSTIAIYANGTSLSVSYTNQSNLANPIGNWPTATTQYFGVGASTTTPYRDAIYRSVLFNRALSAAEVVDLIETGVNPADQWGSQTAAYSSDFSAGANNWAGVRSTVTGNVDGVLGVNDTLRTVVDGTASNSHYAVNSTVPGMVAGKRYKVAFDYYIPSANAILNGVRLDQLIQNSPITANQTTTGAWATTSPVQFIALGSRLDLLGMASGNNTFNGNSTDEFYLKNMVLTRIGAIVDLDFTTGIGYQAFDSSTNKLDGTLFNGVSWTQPNRIGFARGTLTTNAGQQLLGTLAIPTDAHIDYVVVENVSAGSSATFSMGTASGTLTNILNAQPLGGNGTKTTFDPVDGFSSTGNLWCAWSAAGTVKVTVAYRQVL